MSRPGTRWRDKKSETEEILWFAQADQGINPPRCSWTYEAAILPFIAPWPTGSWVIETIRDFWKVLFCTLGFVFVLYADRYVRAQCIYTVATQYAWEFNKSIKSKYLEFNRFMNFSNHAERSHLGITATRFSHLVICLIRMQHYRHLTNHKRPRHD